MKAWYAKQFTIKYRAIIGFHNIQLNADTCASNSYAYKTSLLAEPLQRVFPSNPALHWQRLFLWKYHHVLLVQPLQRALPDNANWENHTNSYVSTETESTLNLKFHTTQIIVPTQTSPNLKSTVLNSIIFSSQFLQIFCVICFSMETAQPCICSNLGQKHWWIDLLAMIV